MDIISYCKVGKNYSTKTVKKEKFDLNIYLLYRILQRSVFIFGLLNIGGGSS